MPGIYIHIPFCKKACYYCSFHFATSLLLKNEMIHSLKRELHLHTNDKNAPVCGMILPKGELIETLYFGGGTPSILLRDELGGIIREVNNIYRIADNAEITLEANPDDITEEKLADWKELGINRLSVGIQSFIERDLHWMNRAHNAEQAINCLSLIRKAGYTNYSIDLIFGIPHLSDEEWEENINRVIDIKAPHIACYALTVEPKTALDKMIRSGKKEDINSDEQARQFEILMQKLREAGYEHYEISNFSLPGSRSRHNSSYWQQKPYLGIGPSAHSYDGQNRYWNISNNAIYIRSVEEEKPFFEKENLSPGQRLHEYIMTSLRTSEGTGLKNIENDFGIEHRDYIINKLKEVDPGWYLLTQEKIILTDKGKLFADRISVMLFE